MKFTEPPECGTLESHWLTRGGRGDASLKRGVFRGYISDRPLARKKKNPRLPFLIHREQPSDNTNQLYIDPPSHS